MRLPSLSYSPNLFRRTFCFQYARIVLVLIDVTGATSMPVFLSSRLELVKADISFVIFSLLVVEILFNITDLCEGSLHNFLLDEQKWLKLRTLDGETQLPQISTRKRPVDCILKKEPLGIRFIFLVLFDFQCQSTGELRFWCGFADDEKPCQPFEKGGHCFISSESLVQRVAVWPLPTSPFLFPRNNFNVSQKYVQNISPI